MMTKMVKLCGKEGRAMGISHSSAGGHSEIPASSCFCFLNDSVSGCF